MQHTHNGLMAGRTVLVTGGSGGIGKATALRLATMGAHVAITGRDVGRTESAAAEIRAAAGGQVEVFVADLSSQSEVRRLAGEVLDKLSRIEYGQPRRGVLGYAPHQRRRARTNLRPQPLGAFPAHQPAPRPTEKERPGPCNHRLVQRAGYGPGELRRPSGRSVLLRLKGLQPVQAGQRFSLTNWPGCCGAAPSPPMHCTPAS